MRPAQGALSHERVLYRASLAASGLRRLRVPSGDPVAILVCDEHAEDRAVALLASARNANRALELEVRASLEELRIQLSAVRGAILFACPEGTQEWRATNIPMRVIGDGLETLWWRTFELREMAAAATSLVVSSPGGAEPEPASALAS
jgi:hypothetical protein